MGINFESHKPVLDGSESVEKNNTDFVASSKRSTVQDGVSELTGKESLERGKIWRPYD